MRPKQVFLLLTTSFMSAMSGAEFNRTRIQRALEAAVQFSLGDHLDPEQSAFEYAQWVVNGGKPPSWLPVGFNHGYLG